MKRLDTLLKVIELVHDNEVLYNQALQELEQLCPPSEELPVWFLETLPGFVHSLRALARWDREDIANIAYFMSGCCGGCATCGEPPYPQATDTEFQRLLWELLDKLRLPTGDRGLLGQWLRARLLEVSDA